MAGILYHMRHIGNSRAHSRFYLKCVADFQAILRILPLSTLQHKEGYGNVQHSQGHIQQ